MVESEGQRVVGNGRYFRYLCLRLEVLCEGKVVLRRLCDVRDNEDLYLVEHHKQFDHACPLMEEQTGDPGNDRDCDRFGDRNCV